MNFMLKEHPEYKNADLFAIKSSYDQHNDYLFEYVTKIMKLFTDLEEYKYFASIKESIITLSKIHAIKEKKNDKIKKSEFKEFL